MTLIEKISQVICACCVLHNFILKTNPDDMPEGEFDVQSNCNENDNNDAINEERN